MANTKISQLPANNNPTGNEELVYAANNTNGKMKLSTLKTFVQPDMTGYQEALESGVNIKTINGYDILGSGNVDISGGGGGSTGVVSLSALEDIAAGTLVSFTGTGVQKLRRGFYGTASTGISLTVNTQQWNRIGSCLVNDDTTVVVYMDGTSSAYVVAIQWNGETRTVGTPVQITGTVKFPKICCPYEGEFVVAYSDESKVTAIAGSVSGTTITLGTAVSVSTHDSLASGIGITRTADTDSRAFTICFSQDTDKYLYSNQCTYNSSLVITAGTDAVLRGGTSSKGYVGVDYLGGGKAGVIFDYVNSGTYTTEFIYINTTGSISSSNRITLSSGNSANIGYAPKSLGVTDSLVMVDVGVGNTGIFLINLAGLMIAEQSIPRWSYPVMGRAYCSEDYSEGIFGMFYVGYDRTNSLQMYYARYRGTSTGLEFIDKVLYGSGNANSQPTVVRQGNVSVCTYIDGADAVLGNLLYQDESNQFVGIIEEAAETGESVDVTYNGVVDTTGLTSGSPIYIGLDGATATSGVKQIGIALSSTQALLK